MTQKSLRKVTFNISGLKFKTRQETLEKYPDTLLADATRRSKYYDKDEKEYFFDRNRTAFDAILYYYQSGGKLIRPPSVPLDVFADELRFYQLGDTTVQQLLEEEGYFDDEEETILPEGEFQRKVWQLFEYPDTSIAARVVAIVSVSVIVISIVTFCLETLPIYRLKKSCTPVPTTASPITPNSTTTTPKLSCEMVPRDDDKAMPWFAIEATCIAWFTFEYVMRLLSSPQKLIFVRSFLNLIDVIAIVPFYITLPLPASSISSLSVLRVLRLVRVFRIFKLSRHSRGLQILGMTLKSSLRELCLLVFFLLIGVVLFSSAVYYAEGGDSSLIGGTNQFLSIPHAFWWAIVTTTTVGYGDIYPTTPVGKIVGSLCAIVGVLTVALPVPVIVSNFNYYYVREHDIQAAKEGRRERERRLQDLNEDDSSDDDDGDFDQYSEEYAHTYSNTENKSDDMNSLGSNNENKKNVPLITISDTDNETSSLQTHSLVSWNKQP